uniref:Putative transposon protein n=1 Tax=Oryza sativa subsp. indica TaxID=39946 RepID=C5NNU0_ORYSI|nr:putative transposon protein [Oryza sativa Indica Group]
MGVEPTTFCFRRGVQTIALQMICLLDVAFILYITFISSKETNLTGRQPSHLSPYRSPLLATPISASAAAMRVLRHRREHHQSAVVLLLVERSFEGSARVLTGAWGSGLAGAGSGGSSGALEKRGERHAGQAKRRSQRRAGR